MARNDTHVNASPSAVWDVLADPYAYPRWVVGTDRTLEAEATWPSPGSKFKVHIALGYSDYTHCVEAEPERRIKLNVAGGPMGAALVEITLKGTPDGGTDVTIVEDPTGIMKPLHYLPPAHWLIKVRNVESMRRFKRIVEARAARNNGHVHGGTTEGVPA
jgi:uncharacterized protein YndB with AHSA1/START domain